MTNANLKLDIHNKIPDVLLDNTDRNRTSPFAFTGNKFEFRAVGSSANCAQSMTTMNTIMGQQLLEFKKDYDKLVKDGESKEGAVMRVLRRYITESKNIVFEGDGYSEAWEKEAKKRGLSNVKTTPYALDFFITKKAKEVYVKNGIYSDRELEARYDIWNHNYILKIDIEARTLVELATNNVLPVAIEYSNKLITHVQGLKAAGLPVAVAKAQKDVLSQLAVLINKLSDSVDKLKTANENAHKAKTTSLQAKTYCDKVKPLLDEVREYCDAIELLVDDSVWTLPKYREMLFIR